MSNSEHRRMGEEFQKEVREWLQRNYQKEFVLEKGLPIGEPKKEHYFDIAAADDTMVIECKRYTWTVSGNVPSAKIRTLNEAVFFLRLLPETYEKIIVMLKTKETKNNETLATYYVRTYGHLLGGVRFAEYDPESGELQFLPKKKNTDDQEVLK